jgi:hypothetical protein
LNNNWIIANLTWAFNTWNEKMSEIWTLVSLSPQNFKGGSIWGIIVNISGGLQAIGYGLLILFFAIDVFKSTASFRELKHPEQALRLFIRFVAAKTAVTYGMEVMTVIFNICGGVVTKIAESMGGATASRALPGEIETAIESLGFINSIPLWFVTLLGSLFITVMSFIMILTVYARFFRIYIYTAIAPVALSSFAGETTSATGKAFIKSYIGVCIEGAVIILSCVIYSAFAGSGGVALGGGHTDAVTMVWAYLAETVFSMLVLVGLVKGADRFVKEMLALG